ncbi:hypothetical protein ABTZ59_36605 [Streptomyces sp. NPDC094034]|uniref:hypothetical protein n=1 Tax=Streptomyces sp. NPDC094034 TaxID=3155309 RepID=UPI00333015E1
MVAVQREAVVQVDSAAEEVALEVPGPTRQSELASSAPVSSTVYVNPEPEWSSHSSMA